GEPPDACAFVPRPPRSTGARPRGRAPRSPLAAPARTGAATAVRLRGAGQVADAELVEGELEDRVRIHRVLHTVPEHVGVVMSLRNRAIARCEVDRGREAGVAVRLVLVVVAPLREVAAPVDAGLAEVDRAGLGKGRPELVTGGEEGDVLDEVALHLPHHGVVRARVEPLRIIKDAMLVR